MEEDQKRLLEIWKTLDVLTVSLDRLGYYWLEHGETAGQQALSAFIRRGVAQEIAISRKLATELLERYDPNIDDALETLARTENDEKYWNGPDVAV